MCVCRSLLQIQACMCMGVHGYMHFLTKDFIYLFLERGEGREKESERNISVWLPLMHLPTVGLAHNPGVCPDGE